MAFDKNQLLTGGLLMSNVNVTGDTNSYPMVIDGRKLISLDTFIDNNNLVGVISIQGCNDPHRTTPNWVEITNVSVSSGVDTQDLIDIVDIGCKYIKVFFDHTSGDGLMTVVAHSKV